MNYKNTCLSCNLPFELPVWALVAHCSHVCWVGGGGIFCCNCAKICMQFTCSVLNGNSFEKHPQVCLVQVENCKCAHLCVAETLGPKWSRWNHCWSSSQSCWMIVTRMCERKPNSWSSSCTGGLVPPWNHRWPTLNLSRWAAWIWTF